jgi:hypothetical protein
MINKSDFVTCPEEYENNILVGQVKHVITKGMLSFWVISLLSFN